jgi:WhiB family redox-sensing transcriptional regulator
MSGILWVNVLLMTVFFGLWVGIPLWMVLRRADAEPEVIAAPVAAAAPEPRVEQPAYQRVAQAGPGRPDTGMQRSTTAQCPDWRDDAACRRVDPELFFPISALGAARPQINAAKQVCGRCPVRVPCLRWALDTGQDAGIWGGTTEQERRLLRRVPAPG